LITAERYSFSREKRFAKGRGDCPQSPRRLGESPLAILRQAGASVKKIVNMAGFLYAEAPASGHVISSSQ
jgi:hypothetical protein